MQHVYITLQRTAVWIPIEDKFFLFSFFHCLLFLSRINCSYRKTDLCLVRNKLWGIRQEITLSWLHSPWGRMTKEEKISCFLNNRTCFTNQQNLFCWMSQVLYEWISGINFFFFRKKTMLILSLHFLSLPKNKYSKNLPDSGPYHFPEFDSESISAVNPGSGFVEQKKR